MHLGRFISLFVAVFSILTGKEFLLRVNRPADDLLSHYLPVVAEFEGYSLFSCSETEITILQEQKLPYEILIENPQSKTIFYVKTQPNFDRNQLLPFGSILTSDENGVLLATVEEHILSLNRLPVELCRLRIEPLSTHPGLPPLKPPVSVSESLIQELVSRVNADSVLGTIRRLQDFYTRYSTTESCRAAVSWMGEKLTAYGCDSVAFDCYRPGYAPNLVGVKHGQVNPRQIYIICGHIDNTSNYAPEQCPGSDDNASGTSAVLEAARVFQDIDFAYSVYFVGFTGEEQGLYGSDSFASWAYARGDSIRAVLNFDMISYGRENLDTLNVVGKTSNPNCAWLVDSFIANANRYTTLKTKRRLVTSYPYSDHHSFWQRGYVALCGIERDFTPKYHTIGDTVGPLYYVDCGTNNWLMATEAIKATVATLAKMAGALPPGTGLADHKPNAFRINGLRVTPTVGQAPFMLQAVGTVDVFNPLGVMVGRIPAGSATGTGGITPATPCRRVFTSCAPPPVRLPGLSSAIDQLYSFMENKSL
ncbi:MAG: M28 family metallopeptidase [bacterium]